MKFEMGARPSAERTEAKLEGNLLWSGEEGCAKVPM